MLACVSAPAQQLAPDGIADSGTVIRTETKVVLVDTVVMDKKGNYLRNLTAKDFKVWEDNKEQQIKSFGIQSDPNSPGGAQKHYIVLFFDNSTMDPGGQVQARQAAGKFVDSNAGPNRLMAIVNFGGSIQIAQNFTEDPARLKQAVGGVKMSAVGRSGGGGLSRAAMDFGARDMLMALRSLSKNLNTIPGRKTLILFTAGFPLNSERISEVTATVDACNKSNVAVYPIDVRGLIAGAPAAALQAPSSSGVFARAFGAILQPVAFTSGTGFASGTLSPGMSFFQRGGGAPAGGGGGATGGGGAAGGGGGRGGGAPGAGAPGAGGGAPGRGGTAPAPSPTTGNMGGRGGQPGGFGSTPNMGMIPPSQARNILIPKIPDSGVDNQNVMQMLADGTGGFVIRNSNDLFAGLEKIGHEMDEYYVLGYTPPPSEEGTCHSLRVKVDQGGSVRARSGYCNSRPQDVLAGTTAEKTLESRVAGSQAGTIAASMQLPFFYTSPNVARVNVAMEISGDVMKFEKEKGKFHGEMNVLGIAYNTDGSVAARFSDTLKRDFEDKRQVEAFEQHPFHYENEFEVASGKYNLKVVFNAGGAGFGKVESPLTIDPWESQFGLSGLALSREVRPAAQAQGLDASLIEDRVPLITSDGVQVVPFGSNKFQKSQPVLFYVEVYEPLLQSAEAGNKPQVGIQIRILDRKTKEQKYSTGLMRLDYSDKGDNPTIPMAARIPLDSVGAGQYTVEMQARDTAGKLATRTADFDLE